MVWRFEVDIWVTYKKLTLYIQLEIKREHDIGTK